MSKPSTFLLISLPTSITNTNDREDALDALQSTIKDNGTTTAFAVPTFKIGTLDALVQQADELAKLNNACEAVVAKVGDSLRSILDNDEGKIAQQKLINDSTSYELCSILAFLLTTVL
jgi:V-type H+-transporting ATPase subunit C